MPLGISLIETNSYSAIVGCWRETRQDLLIRSSAAGFILLCFLGNKRPMLSTLFWIARNNERGLFVITNGGLAGCLISICGGLPPGTPRSLWKCSFILKRFLNSSPLSAQFYPGTRYAISASAGDFAFFTCWSRSKSEHQR